MFFQNISYLTVVVAAIVGTGIGFLWYSPIAFGRPWMREMGITADSMEEFKKKNGKRAMIKTHTISTLFTLVSAYILAALLNSLIIVSFSSLIVIALFLWLAFSMPIALNYTLYGGKQSYTLFAINTGHQLVTLVVMTLIIGIFS